MAFFHNPAVPFVAPINGGASEGLMIQVAGQPTPNASWFAINLQCGPNVNPRDDIVLHLMPRFEGTTSRVIRNSLRNQLWEQEESFGHFPFAPAQPFEILLLIEDDSLKVAINGEHYTDFRYRIPYHNINTIAIDGDVQLYSIHYEGGNAGYPPEDQMVQQSNVAYGANPTYQSSTPQYGLCLPPEESSMPPNYNYTAQPASYSGFPTDDQMMKQSQGDTFGVKPVHGVIKHGAGYRDVGQRHVDGPCGVVVGGQMPGGGPSKSPLMGQRQMGAGGAAYQHNPLPQPTSYNPDEGFFSGSKSKQQAGGGGGGGGGGGSGSGGLTTGQKGIIGAIGAGIAGAAGGYLLGRLTYPGRKGHKSNKSGGGGMMGAMGMGGLVPGHKGMKKMKKMKKGKKGKHKKKSGSSSSSGSSSEEEE